MTSREKKGEGGGRDQEGRGGEVGPGADRGGQHREAEVARREAEAARREDGGQEAAAQVTVLHYWMYLGTYIGTYLPTSIPLELSDTFQHIPANPMKSVTL